MSRFPPWRARARARAKEGAIPVVLGVLAFFGVTGGRILSPRNIAWLGEGDAVQYFLSWHFFRNSPWGFPLGSNPKYGAEIGSSIAYADNLPLFALPLKAAQGWLPNTFQYFGIWILCCFVLQAWFAWLLVGLFTRARLLRASGAALFVFAPPFLWRLNGHYQLFGQWLVLAALYLSLGRRELARGAAWPLLAFTVSLVHSYLTAMVLGLWIADWLRRMFFDGRTRADFVQLLVVPAVVVLALWQAGLFMVGPGAVKAGFGEYRMNVFSLVDASGWSYLLPDVPEGAFDYEGFNFFGLGGLILALAALPALEQAWPGLRRRPRYWPLLALAVACTLFAFSNRVGVGARTFIMPLSPAWVERANTLRSSGRMFWPAFYLVLWVLLRALCRYYRPRAAAALVFAAVLVQAADTSAGWWPIRQRLMVAGSTWNSPLKSAFWAQVPANYDEIRLVPTRNIAPHHAVFGYFAALHGLSTDSVYLARVDKNELKRARHEAQLAVQKARYAPRTLYILERSYEAAARRSLKPTALLQDIDGFLVLAPDWKCRPACPAAGPIEKDCAADCP